MADQRPSFTFAPPGIDNVDPKIQDKEEIPDANLRQNTDWKNYFSVPGNFSWRGSVTGNDAEGIPPDQGILPVLTSGPFLARQDPPKFTFDANLRQERPCLPGPKRPASGSTQNPSKAFDFGKPAPVSNGHFCFGSRCASCALEKNAGGSQNVGSSPVFSFDSPVPAANPPPKPYWNSTGAAGQPLIWWRPLGQKPYYYYPCGCFITKPNFHLHHCPLTDRHFGGSASGVDPCFWEDVNYKCTSSDDCTTCGALALTSGGDSRSPIAPELDNLDINQPILAEADVKMEPVDNLPRPRKQRLDVAPKIEPQDISRKTAKKRKSQVESRRLVSDLGPHWEPPAGSARGGTDSGYPAGHPVPVKIEPIDQELVPVPPNALKEKAKSRRPAAPPPTKKLKHSQKFLSCVYNNTTRLLHERKQIENLKQEISFLRSREEDLMLLDGDGNGNLLSFLMSLERKKRRSIKNYLALKKLLKAHGASQIRFGTDHGTIIVGEDFKIIFDEEI